MNDKSIYMDYNATTPIDPKVIEEIIYAMQFTWVNPSSTYKAGIYVKNAIEKSRGHVANMISSKPDEIIFTSGGTESNNMVINSIVDDYLERYSKPPRIISSTIEHDSIMKLLLKLEKDRRIILKQLKISAKTGTIDINELSSCLTEDTALVTIMLANNETGIIQPIRSISKTLREYSDKNQFENKILLHSDAGQAFGKIPVSVEDLGVDYLTIVGHKFYGPRIGALYVRDLHRRGHHSTAKSSIPIRNLFFGGGQEGNLRSGTENTPMIVGLGKAAELVYLNIDKYNRNMKKIRDYLETCLLCKFNCFGCKILSKFSTLTDYLPNTCNIALVTNFPITGPEILSKCQRLQASVGAACHSVITDHQEFGGSEILKRCGFSSDECRSAIRLSIGRETTKQDVDDAVADLFEAVSYFAHRYNL